jgi:hypothetical protein
MDAVAYRDFSDAGRNEAEELPAIARRPDVLVRADDHHRNGDLLQQLRQLPADRGWVEQRRRRPRRRLRPAPWRRRLRRRSGRENDPVRVYARVDERGVAVNGGDELGER